MVRRQQIEKDNSREQRELIQALLDPKRRGQIIRHVRAGLPRFGVNGPFSAGLFLDRG